MLCERTPNLNLVRLHFLLLKLLRLAKDLQIFRTAPIDYTIFQGDRKKKVGSEQEADENRRSKKKGNNNNLPR